MESSETSKALQPVGEQALAPLSEEEERALVRLKLQYFSSAAVPTAVLLELLGAGWGGLGLAAFAGFGAFWFAKDIHYAVEPGVKAAQRLISVLFPETEKVPRGRTLARLTSKEWWMTGQVSPLYAEQAEEPVQDRQSAGTQEMSAVPGAPRRLNVDEIVSRTERNSFKICIGRSLTKEGNPPVTINIYKQHFKFIGASQRGKSSMAAAFMEIITRTHSPERVLLALLDLEDQTSKLFADRPHVAELLIDGEPLLLHARSRDQVVEYLNHIVDFMNYRYTLSKHTILQEPIVLVYIEEFLALKKYLRKKIESAMNDEAKKLAKKAYSDFVYAISEIALRGLKVRVQLLLCAQVDYRDDDKELQEALISVTSGMSFCVRSTAAQAAGFYQTELLNRNAREDKVGQAVVEMPGCTDLVLAPDFDLERRLVALEEAEMEGEEDGYDQIDQGRMVRGAGTHSRSHARRDGERQPVPAAQREEHVLEVERQHLEDMIRTGGLEKLIAALAQVQAERQTEDLPTVPTTPTLPTALQKALDVYRPGMGYREMGDALGIGKDKAGELIKDLRKRGLIDQE